jgi:phage terminase large subunit
MNRKSEREIENEIDDLRHTAGETDAPTDVTVEWRVPSDPDPDDDGITYDPETKTLTYELWKAQHACLDALESGEFDIVVLLGGYGSGKSVFGARWLVAQALAHPQSRFLAMGTTFAEAREATFAKLFSQLPGDRTESDPERSPVVANYTKSEQRLTFTNGSVIVLGSADKWNRYTGDEFGAIWLDEASHYDADLHRLLEMMGSRLRGVTGPKVQCWTLTGNGYNAAWEIIEQRRDSTGEPLQLNIELIRASTLDNPYLESDELERFERQFAGTERAQQALHGGFSVSRGLVYSGFHHDTHVIPTAEARGRVDDEWRIYSYDAGWNSPRVLLEIGKTSDDQLVVLDLFYETESHVDDAIAWLDANDKPQGPIYCDHDPEDLAIFKQHGYRAENAEKTLDDGISEVRRRLEADGTAPIGQTTSRTKTITRHGSPKDLREQRHKTGNWTDAGPGRERLKRPKLPGTSVSDGDSTTDGDGRVGLLVAEDCRPLIQEFLSYKEEHVGKTDADDHCLDALRYAVMGTKVT